MGDRFGQLVEDLVEGCGSLDASECFQIAVVARLRSGGTSGEYD